MPSEDSRKSRTQAQVSFAEPEEELKELFIKVETQEQEKTRTETSDSNKSVEASDASIETHKPPESPETTRQESWTLQDELKKLAAPVPQEKAIQIVMDLCDHVSSGIQAKILSPENIALKSENEFCLLGIQESSTPASNAYIAPENRQLESKHSVVYSLGSLLYELLSNNDHSAAQNPEFSAELSKWLAHSPSWNAVPTGLKQIIRNCLHDDQALRYKSPGDLKEALENFLRPHARLQGIGVIPVQAKKSKWPAIVLTIAVLAGSIFTYNAMRAAESLRNLDPQPVITQPSNLSIAPIPAGSYQGNVGYNFRNPDPVTTTLRRTADGVLEGDYVVTEDAGPFTGTIKQISESPTEVIMEWNDKYGSGALVINSADGTNFSGYWTHAGEVAGSWSGSLSK